MKKSWLNLTSVSFAAMLVMTTACQEKVAPELTDAGIGGAAAGAGGGGGGGSTATQNFWISLGTTSTGKTPTQLKYQIHKANELLTSECKVEDVVDTPGTLSSLRDITCYVEAEEAVLFNNGIGLQVNAEPGACEYVAYMPYSFVRRQPGLSTGENGGARPLVQYVCSNTFAGVFALESASSAIIGVGNPDNLTYNQLCGRIVEVNGSGNITSTSPRIVSPTELNLGAYCSFDYSLTDDGLPNCDGGSMELTTYTIDVVDTNGSTTITTTDTPSVALESTDHQCDGNPRLCVDGPILEGVESYVTTGSVGIVEDSITEEATYTKNYTISAPEEKGFGTNRYVSNFTRQCSGVSTWNTLSIFAGSSNSYNPDIIAEYATLGVDTSVGPTTDARGFTVRRLADDPFRGDPIVETNPHYTFLCLDGAYEIRARARITVREWNKQFNVLTTSFAFVSDVFNDLAAPFSAIMDATQSQVVPWGILRPENDVGDWDDSLTWDDSAGASCSTSFMNDGVNGVGTSFWFPGDSL